MTLARKGTIVWREAPKRWNFGGQEEKLESRRTFHNQLDSLLDSGRAGSAIGDRGCLNPHEEKTRHWTSERISQFKNLTNSPTVARQRP